MHKGLHTEIAREVVRTCRVESLTVGALIGELTFAKRLGVSRAPVRRALQLLAEEGILEHKPGVGFLLKSEKYDEIQFLNAQAQTEQQDLLTSLMADRARGLLPQEVSENELITRYRSQRGTVRKALQRLAADNLVYRLRGHGWRFVDSLDDERAIAESYAFRIEMECASLRQKYYRIDRASLAHIRAHHLEFMSKQSTDLTREDWFWINANFHEALGAWSQNRFFHQAIRQQNSLRRMHQYADFPTLTEDEIRISCQEHLAIMEALEKKEMERAEELLRQHLTNAFFGP